MNRAERRRQERAARKARKKAIAQPGATSNEPPVDDWVARMAPAGAAIEIGPDPDDDSDEPVVPKDIYSNGCSINDTGVGVLINGGENIQLNGTRVNAAAPIVARNASLVVKGARLRRP